jgi:hypothetical protein
MVEQYLRNNLKKITFEMAATLGSLVWKIEKIGIGFKHTKI